MRIYLARADGYRLLFSIAALAFLLHILSVLTLSAIQSFDDDVSRLVQDFTETASISGFESGVVALALGPLLAIILSAVIRVFGATPATATKRFIQHRTDPFEMLLMEFLESQELLMTIDVDYADTHSAIRDEVIHQYEKAVEAFLDGELNATLDDVEDELFGTIDTSRLGVVNFETVILAREIQTLSPFEPGIYQRHFDRTAPEK